MTKNLIFSLCRNDSSHKNAILANEIISQILNIIQKNVNNSEVSLFIKFNQCACFHYTCIFLTFRLLNHFLKC